MSRSRLPRSALVGAFAGLVASAGPARAWADEPAPVPSAPAERPQPSAPPEHPTVLPPDPTLAPGAKRPEQDYEGRPPVTTVAEDALWIPRVALFPLYVVSDFVIRRPLGAITMAVDKGGFLAKVQDFFTFGPHNNVGLVPTAFYAFGFRASVGVYHFYDDFLAKDNQLRASLATGGEKYFTARVVDRIPLQVSVDASGAREVRSRLQLELGGIARPDYLFYGVGWRAAYADESRFEQRSVGGGVRVHVEPLDGNFVEGWALFRHHAFSDGECRSYPRDCSTRPISFAVKHGRYALPSGFDGYDAVKAGIRGVVDSRRPRPLPGSGVVAEARVELSADVGAQGEWAQLGGTVGGYVDLTGSRRMLGLLLDVRAIEPFTSGFQVPFTELIGAGRTDGVPDDDLLRGFAPGRLLGQSSISATLEYAWPIWSFIDATLQAQVGNVFGHELEDFELERLRFSFVGGFRSPNHRDHGLNFLVGFGTKPFVDGGAPDTLRLLLGGTTGF